MNTDIGTDTDTDTGTHFAFSVEMFQPIYAPSFAPKNTRCESYYQILMGHLVQQLKSAIFSLLKHCE